MPTDLTGYILTGVATVALGLAMWILNSVSKRVSRLEEKAGENDTRLHKRIDDLVSARMTAWLKKEEDCRKEDTRIARLEERLKVKEPL